MTRISQRTRVALIGIALAASGILLPPIVWTGPDAREVRLVARGMRYYVEGSAEPNPVLRFKPGEQVRLSLRNDDKGMSHDFRIPRWQVGTAVVPYGDQAQVSFRVPANAGALEYACTPHSAMMGGEVLVQQ